MLRPCYLQIKTAERWNENMMDYIKPEMEILILQLDVVTLSQGKDDEDEETPSVDYDVW